MNSTTISTSKTLLPTPQNPSIQPIPPSIPSNPANRRQLLAVLSLSITTPLTLLTSNTPISPPLTYARGLFRMPPFKLNNRYFLVRAGESHYESLGVINTNPVAKTSVDNGLSENGKRQTIRAALELKKMGACEGSCWIWPSITQRAYQAAEVIASVNSVDRSRIVPEYSFLDARGLGAYEGRPLESVSEVYESDGVSPGLKPPPTSDGTPNESVDDVFVRVTQLMSITETQYSEETVIIVHRDLSFNPGEVRLVDVKSIPAYKKPTTNVYKCLNPPNCR
ncbi:hypothetical protein KSS87_020626 [Heliosperma pusillum]|nr:hypothetical protein KSS87_020626 [Heliosperma pusillum]